MCVPIYGIQGWRLTTLFGNTAVMTIAVPKKKGSLLPLLTVVFLASYGLMTLLIVEQGATIQSQRNLIQVLQSDSTELLAMKGKALHQMQVAQAQAQRQTQPSTQTPSTQTPSTQAVPQHHSQSRAGKFGKPRSHAPQSQVPPMPASDLGDQRRTLISL
jgi:hypothetical protein